MAGAMRIRRKPLIRVPNSSSCTLWAVMPSSSPGRSVMRSDTMWTSWPRSATRQAQRRKIRLRPSPTPRMRSGRPPSSATRAAAVTGSGSATSTLSATLRELHHLLVLRVTPLAERFRLEVEALAGPLEARHVVVEAVAVEVANRRGGLPDRVEVSLAVRVLEVGRVEAPAGHQHAVQVDQAADDRVKGQVREHG